MKSLQAFENGTYLICALCIAPLEVVQVRKPRTGQVALSCLNPSCYQYDQPFWHHYREVVLDDMVNPDDLKGP